MEASADAPRDLAASAGCDDFEDSRQTHQVLRRLPCHRAQRFRSGSERDGDGQHVLIPHVLAHRVRAAVPADAVPVLLAARAAEPKLLLQPISVMGIARLLVRLRV